MRRLLKGFAITSIALSLVVGLTGTSYAARVGATSLGSGSDTIFNLMQKLDALYNGSPGCSLIAPVGKTQSLGFKCYANQSTTVTTENYYHDRFVEASPLGSSVGISQLCAQGQSGVTKIQYARSSRAKSSTDCSNLVFTEIAADGISWWTGSSNTHINDLPWVNNAEPSSSVCANAGDPNCAPNLTKTQIQAIWGNCGGKAAGLQTWGDITGNAGDTTPIQVYAAQSGSGTRAAFEKSAGITDSTACIPAQYKDGTGVEHVGIENSAAQLKANGNDGDGILYYSYGRFQQNQGSDGGQLGAIDGVQVNTDTILGQDSSGNPVTAFSFSRPLNLVYTKVATGTRPAASPAITDYMNPVNGWLCKTSTHAVNPLTGNNFRTDIENAISSEGFIPLPTGTVGGGFVGSSHCRAQST